MTKCLSNAEHICVLVNEGEGYCSASPPFLQGLAEDEGDSRTFEAAGFQAPTFFFDKMGRCHSPVPMDWGQSSSSEEVQQGLPSRLRGQRGRLNLQGPLDVGWRGGHLFSAGECCLLPHCAWISMPYDVCFNILLAIALYRVVLGCCLEVLAIMEATTRPPISNVMPVFGTLLTCLDSYNHAVALIDGQIQKIKVNLVAMLFVWQHCFTTRLTSICLLFVVSGHSTSSGESEGSLQGSRAKAPRVRPTRAPRGFTNRNHIGR